MSQVEVDKVIPQSGTTLTIGDSGDTITVPSGATLTNNGTATGFGKILQVVGTQTTTQFSTTSSGMVDVTGFSLAITPSSTSNKILVLLHFRYGNDTSGANACQLLRNASVISLGDAGNNLSNVYVAHGSTSQGFGDFSVSYLDTPNSTSELTYKLQVRASAGTLIINGRNDGSSQGDKIGSLTLMEIEG